jgi:hypothetical protein
MTILHPLEHSTRGTHAVSQLRDHVAALELDAGLECKRRHDDLVRGYDDGLRCSEFSCRRRGVLGVINHSADGIR